MSKVRVFILIVVTIVIFGLGMFAFRNINTNNGIDLSGDSSGDVSGEIIKEPSGEFIDNWLHDENFMKEFRQTASVITNNLNIYEAYMLKHNIDIIIVLWFGD